MCAEVLNEFLAVHGHYGQLEGPQLMRQYVGQNFRGIIASIVKEYGIETTPDEIDAYTEQEHTRILNEIEVAAEPCEGVIEVLEQLHQEARYTLAIVSSSSKTRIVASIKRIGALKYFHSDNIFSAATSLAKPTSKPDPAIYLHACEQLAVDPQACVAIEDSRSGATAARHAHINLIGYVGPCETELECKQMAHILHDECGAHSIMENWRDFFDCLDNVAASLPQGQSPA